MSRFSRLEFETLPRQQAEPVSQPVQENEAFHLREAANLFEQGEFEGALRAYAKALEHNAKNPASWTGQVRMLIELGEFREAKLWASKALEMFPHESELLAAKAVALARLGDVKAAMAFSDASFAERGDSPYLWLARADVLLAQREARADYCFERAVTLDPANWLLHWLSSRINAYHGRFVQAFAGVQRALALDTSRLQVWLQLAMCQHELGMQEAAIVSADHALYLSPLNPLAREMRADFEMTSWSSLLWRRFRNLFRR